MLDENDPKKIKAMNILNSFERQINQKKKKKDEESLIELTNNIFFKDEENK